MDDRFDEMESDIMKIVTEMPGEKRILAAYLRAEFGKEWISVSERLPECPEYKDDDLGWLVLRPKTSRKRDITYIHPDWWFQDKGLSQEITHWMSLPESPKGEQTE